MNDFTINVETIAGSGTIGCVDGLGHSAQFNYPIGIAVDHRGNLIVCDSKNSKIRKVDVNRNVTTIAGSVAGYKDGPGEMAQFNYPDSIAIDNEGNIYVSDGGNKRIRKIDVNRNVTTFSGNGEDDFVDGAKNKASFKEPCWVATGNNGMVYVSDSHRIRLISPDGSVKTIAGTATEGFNDGHASTSQFNQPTGIAVDNSGNIFICDSFNNRIRKIDKESYYVTSIAGNGSIGYKDGPSTSSIFCGPYGITTDQNGNVIVADTLNQRIRLIDVNGVVSTIAGDGTEGYNDGPAKSAKFNFPFGLAIDHSTGNIYLSDVNNHRIRRLIIAPKIQTVPKTLDEIVTKLVQDKKISAQERDAFLKNTKTLTLQDLHNITDNLLEKLLVSLNDLSLISKIHIFSTIKESRNEK